MNDNEAKEHITKETLKKIVDGSNRWSEQVKVNVKAIIDSSKSPEEILQGVLLYLASLNW